MQAKRIIYQGIENQVKLFSSNAESKYYGDGK